MDDQSQAGTSCRPDAIYNVMSARAAETHRSARPAAAAAAAQSLRFPGDRNEPAAVLRPRGKFPPGTRAPGSPPARCSPTSPRPDGPPSSTPPGPRKDLGSGWKGGPSWRAHRVAPRVSLCPGKFLLGLWKGEKSSRPLSFE